MNPTGQSRFGQARIEWAIRLRYSPMPELDMEMLASQLNAFRIGELRLMGKTWEVMFERDAELAVNAQKRYDDIAGREWKVVSDGSLNGDKHALALTYFYDHLKATAALDQDVTGKCDQLIAQVATAHSNYYSCHEILLRVDNPAAKEITAEFRHTPVWFFESRRGYLGYLQHIFDMYGQPCIEGEWLTVVGMGWMRPLSMAFAMKMFPLRDWLLFCTRYGSGFLEGITDAQKDSPEWNQASEALETIANDGVVLHNRGVEFKFLEQAARNSLPFAPIVEKIDGLYAKCYRGVDLATGSRASGGAEGDKGKNPVGASVQAEESGIFVLRDCKWVTGYFNERIDRPIIRYLFNQEPRAAFALMPPIDDNTADDLSCAQGLVPMGLRIALKEAYQRFRWKEPAPGEPCLEAAAAQAIGPNGDNGENNLTTDSTDSTDKPVSSSSITSVKSMVKVPNPADDIATIPARTAEDTPIGAGANPARAQSFDPRMPDTQVDAAAFWSRAGLAPRGADGQVLPMPSLGYALPNAADAIARREYAAAVAHDMSHIWCRLAKVAAIQDDAVFESKLRQLLHDFDALAADLKQDPAGQQVLQQIIRQGFLRGLADGAKATSPKTTP